MLCYDKWQSGDKPCYVLIYAVKDVIELTV